MTSKLQKRTCKINFFSIYVGHFCPPGSGSRDAIDIHIRIRNSARKDRKHEALKLSEIEAKQTDSTAFTSAFMAWNDLLWPETLSLPLRMFTHSSATELRTEKSKSLTLAVVSLRDSIVSTSTGARGNIR
jgi:hypothetical protein